jgi:hypothetical protein
LGFASTRSGVDHQHKEEIEMQAKQYGYVNKYKERVNQRRPRVVNQERVHTKTDQKYRFMDKDPMIDQVLSLVDQSGRSDTAIAHEAFIAPSTIKGWRTKTKRPQRVTLEFVLRVLGYKFEIVRANLQ